MRTTRASCSSCTRSVSTAATPTGHRRSGPRVHGLDDRTAWGTGFRFAPVMHDRGAKKVLGQTIAAGGGIEDGARVLDIVARHPATARHIARKLAQRFVSDEPPQALVDRAAATFTKTDGDLRAVVRVIVTSPEFFAPELPREGERRSSSWSARSARLTRIFRPPPRSCARSQAWEYALSVPAANRLRRDRCHVGLVRRARQPVELCRRDGWRRAARCAPRGPRRTCRCARSDRS